MLVNVINAGLWSKYGSIMKLVPKWFFLVNVKRKYTLWQFMKLYDIVTTILLNLDTLATARRHAMWTTIGTLWISDDTWYAMNGNIDETHACDLWLCDWMRPESGIQGKWTNGVFIDYIIPEYGPWLVLWGGRTAYDIVHNGVFLSPPDVVRGTMVWKGWFGRPTDILSSPIKVIVVTMTLGYYLTRIRDLDVTWVCKWEYLTLGHYETIVRNMNDM